MPYEKTNWIDRTIEKPMTFFKNENEDGSITLIPNEGIITEVGTPISSDNFNKIDITFSNLFLTRSQINMSYFDIDQTKADKSIGVNYYVTFQNGWSDYNHYVTGCEYSRDDFGIVHLYGIIKPGTLTNGITVFTLPVGYRPKKNFDIITKMMDTNSSLNYTSVLIETSGNVTVRDRMNIKILYLSNIHFRTDA